MEIKYCRRELTDGDKTRHCAQKIETPNALNWCNSCRAHLPLWPTDWIVSLPVVLDHMHDRTES